MATATDGRKIAPGVVDTQAAKRALRRIREVLQDRELATSDIKVRVETGEGDALVLPHPVVEMFADILATLAKGQGVQIMPFNAELTTQQAADMMNVSRPYLIGLLEQGLITYRLVGRHRRIRFDDLMAYLREDGRKRADALDELTQLDQELGLD